MVVVTIIMWFTSTDHIISFLVVLMQVSSTVVPLQLLCIVQCINVQCINVQCISVQCINVQCINVQCINVQCIKLRFQILSEPRNTLQYN